VILLPGCGTAPSCTDNPNNICIDENTSESFLDKYRGLKVVEGNIEIVNSQFRNLAALNQLELIKGNLIIRSNASLVELSGLESLRVVEGDIILSQNKQLANLKGLQSLTKTTSFTIERNALIDSLSDLTNIREVGGLKLRDLDSLEAIDNLGDFSFRHLSVTDNKNLTTIRDIKNVNSDGNLSFANNPVLKELILFEQVDETLELSELTIAGNPSLNRIVIYNVESIGRLYFRSNSLQTELFTDDSLIGTSVSYLSVEESPLLEELVNVQNLKNVSNIHLSNNPSLKSLSLLNEIEQLYLLSLVNNPLITNLSDLSSLQYIDNLRLVGWNHSENLDALSGVSIEKMYISESTTLSSLIGPNYIELRAISLESNSNLVDIEPLNMASKLQRVNLENNPLITSLETLPALTSIDRIRIANMDGLVDLTGLEGIDDAYEISLNGNKGLVSIDSIASLKSVREISIHHNPILNSLYLPVLTEIEGLAIHENPQLCNSLVAPLGEKAQYIRTDITSNKDC